MMAGCLAITFFFDRSFRLRRPIAMCLSPALDRPFDPLENNVNHTIHHVKYDLPRLFMRIQRPIRPVRVLNPEGRVVDKSQIVSAPRAPSFPFPTLCQPGIGRSFLAGFHPGEDGDDAQRRRGMARKIVFALKS